MKTPGPAGPVQGKCRNGNYPLRNSSLHLPAWLTPGAIFSLPVKGGRYQTIAGNARVFDNT